MNKARTHYEDTPYNPEDEEAVANFWEGTTITHKGKQIGKATRGKQKTALKVPVSIRLSPEVVEYFKASGEGWQTRLDEALKAYIAEHDTAA